MITYPSAAGSNPQEKNNSETSPSLRRSQERRPSQQVSEESARTNKSETKLKRYPFNRQCWAHKATGAPPHVPLLAQTIKSQKPILGSLPSKHRPVSDCSPVPAAGRMGDVVGSKITKRARRTVATVAPGPTKARTIYRKLSSTNGGTVRLCCSHLPRSSLVQTSQFAV